MAELETPPQRVVLQVLRSASMPLHPETVAFNTPTETAPEIDLDRDEVAQLLDGLADVGPVEKHPGGAYSLE